MLLAYVILSPSPKGGESMANDLDIVEQQEDLVEVAHPPRVRGNPIDDVGPTCMFWAMVVGLSILLGIMLIWGISHLNTITG
jgi:hypothetical protein